MKAIVFDSAIRLADLPAPARPPGESLIRVLMAGVCNTDIEITKGYMGYSGVLGHEFIGVVEESDSAALIGKRIVGEINGPCGSCALCRRGLPRHCASRTVLGIVNRPGCMAEYLTLPDANLHVVPENVADEEAVFTEPLAAAFEILEQISIEPSDRVLVMGDGKLGLLIAQTLVLSSADVALLGHHADKLAIAARRGVRPLTSPEPGRPYDIVVEATGTSGGLMQALALVRPCGTVVLKSTVADPAPMNLFPVVVDEIHIVGSRCGPFEPALRALAAHSVDVRPMIAAVYPAKDALAAFEHARRRGTLKVLIDFR